MLQIHKKIEQARLSAGLTQDEMAEKLKIKRSTYQYWEQKTPSIDKIEKVANALNLPKDYFFGVSDEKDVAQETKQNVLSNDDLESRRSLERTLENLSQDKIRSTAIIEKLVNLIEEKLNSRTSPATEVSDNASKGTIEAEKELLQNGRTGSFSLPKEPAPTGKKDKINK